MLLPTNNLRNLPSFIAHVSLVAAISLLGAATASAFSLTRLGRIDGQGQTLAYGINNQGEVVGTALVGSDYQGFVWSGGQLSAISGSTALVGIDDAGNAVGWTYSGGNVDAVIYTPKGGVEYLYNPAGSESVIREISSNGNYVGFYEPWNENTNSSAGARLAIVGNLSTPGATSIVAPANTSIEAHAVNNAGLVGGSSYNSNLGEVAAQTFHAPYLATDNTYLGTLDGGFTAVATDVSEDGQVVGYGTIAAGYTRGFATDEQGDMVELGVRNTANSATYNYDARGVNDYGNIVGNENASGTLRVVMYDASGEAYLPYIASSQQTSGLTRIYLPNTTLSGSNYVGSPINEYGQIVAVGVYGSVHEAVLLNPDAPLVTVDASGEAAVARIIEGKNFSSISLGSNELGDFVSFIGGTTEANRTVELSLGQRTPGDISSPQTVELNGTGGDTFVLQLRFLIADYEAEFGSWENARLGWYDIGSSEWVLAVLGNSGGTDEFFNSYYTGTEGLGSYGLYQDFFDSDYAYAWAVLDHNSTFSVIPEPATTTLLLAAAAAALWAVRRKRRC